MTRELIERLERATGPNFELDRLITEATGYPNFYRRPDGSIPHNATFPNFTASIDAAVALVEQKLPGWNWGIMTAKGDADDGKAQGNVYPGEQPFPAEMDVFGYHDCPAIALLLALFKALPTGESKTP